MTKVQLLEKIKDVERIAAASKVHRLFARPLKYANSVLFRKTTYKRNKKEKEVRCKTFFDTEMSLLLPSSTDIYLTGGKSHFSEIKLAKYLIKNLNKGDVFFDIGAHVGYFSLLGSKLVGSSGVVQSFEPTPSTYRILKKNCDALRNVITHNKAVSDKNGEVVFYEFSNLYSEYNSMDISHFKDKKWIKENPPLEIELEAIRLNEYLAASIKPARIVKIDVEGSEYQVIKGASDYLRKYSPELALEYLPEKHGYTGHAKAESLLRSMGYETYALDESGDTVFVENIYTALAESGLESDNIIFKKG